MLDLAEAELDICRPDPRGVVTGFLQHLMGHVDANDPAARTDPLGREKAIEPPATAEIPDNLTGWHRGEPQWIAATEAKIGALRRRCQLRFEIAHAAGGLVRGRGRAAAARPPDGDFGVSAAHHVLYLIPVHGSLR